MAPINTQSTSRSSWRPGSRRLISQLPKKLSSKKITRTKQRKSDPEAPNQSPSEKKSQVKLAQAKEVLEPVSSNSTSTTRCISATISWNQGQLGPTSSRGADKANVIHSGKVGNGKKQEPTYNGGTSSDATETEREEGDVKSQAINSNGAHAGHSTSTDNASLADSISSNISPSPPAPFKATSRIPKISAPQLANHEPTQVHCQDKFATMAKRQAKKKKASNRKAERESNDDSHDPKPAFANQKHGDERLGEGMDTDQPASLTNNNSLNPGDAPSKVASLDEDAEAPTTPASGPPCSDPDRVLHKSTVEVVKSMAAESGVGTPWARTPSMSPLTDVVSASQSHAMKRSDSAIGPHAAKSPRLVSLDIITHALETKSAPVPLASTSFAAEPAGRPFSSVPSRLSSKNSVKASAVPSSASVQPSKLCCKGATIEIDTPPQISSLPSSSSPASIAACAAAEPPVTTASNARGLATHIPHLSEHTKCANCAKEPVKYLVCARCLSARYCGKYCQIWDWQLHGLVCVRSENATDEEVKALEEWIEGYWQGALQMLKDKVVDDNGAETMDGDDGDDGDAESATQGEDDEEVSSHDDEEDDVAMGLDDDGTESTEEEGVDENIGNTDSASGAGPSTLQAEEAQNSSETRPSTPPSMYWSRAMSLHLAKGGGFDPGLFREHE